MTGVLHIHDSSGLYGAESVILSLATAMSKSNYYPIIGCLTGGDQDKPDLGSAAEELALSVEYLPMRSRLDISVVVRLCSVLRKRNIQLMHAHGYKSNLIGLLASKLCGIQIVTTQHLYPPMPLKDKKLQFYSKIDAFYTMKRMAKIIAVSGEIKEKLIAAGLDEHKITVIDNGIDIEKYSNSRDEHIEVLRRSIGIGDDVSVVGTFGRLTQQKGHKYLLEAASKVLENKISAIFLIAGDGPLKTELEKSAVELGLGGKVRFLGFRRDTADLLKIMDVFVMSSIDEGLPMAMIEAMASRKAVLVTSVGEIPKVIKDGVNGMLVPANESDLLAHKLCILLNDAQLRNELAGKAFLDANEHYSKEAMCGKYVSVYNDILCK